MKPIKISPPNTSAFYKGKRIEGNYHLPYYERKKSSFYQNLPVNRVTLIKIWSDLHFKNSHSLPSIRKRSAGATYRFMKNHLPYNGSTRFCNKFTPNGWL